jgi:NmrA-like family
MIPAMLHDTCDILLTCLCYMIRMQGGSVVATYLKRPEWKIRAITLNPSKPATKKLGEQGVEVVLADFNVVLNEGHVTTHIASPLLRVTRSIFLPIFSLHSSLYSSLYS